MMRWLAAATLALIAILAVLWLQIRGPVSETAPTPTAETANASTASASSRTAQLAAIAAQQQPVAQSAKLDPSSDAFFYRFDEAIPPALSREAAKCYTGGLERVHRSAKVKLAYKITIKDGVVAIADVRVIESTIGNKTLEDCFVQKVARVTWRDDELPDWAQDDELVIRPERGMKKYTADNLAYEADGPIGSLERPVGKVAASRELPE